MNLPPVHALVEVYHTEAEWQAARRRAARISATTAATVLGLSPWATPWDAWEEAQGRAPERTAKPWQERGQRLERRTLAEYGQTLHVSAPGDIWGGRWVLLADGWRVQSPDAFAWDGERWGQVDAKVYTQPVWGEGVVTEWGPGAEEIIPLYCAVQGYWQLAVSGLPWVDFAVKQGALVRGRALFPDGVQVVRLCRDEAMQRALVDAVGEWRERHLLRGLPPEVDATPACGRYLAQRFAGGPRRLATAQEASWAARLAYARALGKWAAQQEALAEAYLLASGADADALETPAGVVRFRRVEEQRVAEHVVKAHVRPARMEVVTKDLEAAWTAAIEQQPVLPAKEQG